MNFVLTLTNDDPQMEPCGYCQSCRHNKEYADQVDFLLLALSSIGFSNDSLICPDVGTRYL